MTGFDEFSLIPFVVFLENAGVECEGGGCVCVCVCVYVCVCVCMCVCVCVKIIIINGLLRVVQPYG